MSEEQTNQPRPLEAMEMPELWQLAKSLGISKDGKKDELIARIRATRDQEIAEEPAQENEPARPAKSRAKVISNKRVDHFKLAMQEINMALADYPGLLDIIKVKKNMAIDGSESVRDAYSWTTNSTENAKIRARVKTVLQNAWQSGALNYDMIANALRLPEISVQALLDVEFIENNGL